VFSFFYIKVDENIALCLFRDQMLLILQRWPEYKLCVCLFSLFMCLFVFTLFMYD